MCEDVCPSAASSKKNVRDIFESIALNETHGNQSWLSPRWCLLQFFIATAVLLLATQTVREGEPNLDGFAPSPMSTSTNSQIHKIFT